MNSQAEKFFTYGCSTKKYGLFAVFMLYAIAIHLPAHNGGFYGFTP